MTIKPETIAGPVLLFDGTCGLCNRCVRLLLRSDRHERMHFAPLQSAPAQDYLRSHGLPTDDFDSLIFVPDWSQRERRDFLSRTNGVVAALRVCGGVAGACGAMLKVIPSSWRDAGYKLIARWRYRIWGEWKPRPLAKPAWAARFIG